MRQKHVTMRHASKSHYDNGLIATCDCRKKVGCFQLSCDSMQQSHVAQISPFTRMSHQFCRIVYTHLNIKPTSTIQFQFSHFLFFCKINKKKLKTVSLFLYLLRLREWIHCYDAGSKSLSNNRSGLIDWSIDCYHNVLIDIVHLDHPPKIIC